MRIAFMGDVVTGGTFYEELLRNDFHLFPHKFQMLLDGFDMRVCNLECPLYDGTELKRHKVILRSPTEAIKGLRKARIDLVSLANNHIFDYGVEGFQSTISTLKQYGVNFVGAGMSLESARAPHIVSARGIRIGFLAYAGHLRESTPAMHDCPGVAPMCCDIIEEDILELKRKCDHIVLFLHWGEEYRSFPPIENVYKAKKLLKSGASLIVGTHAHCIQGRASQDGKHAFFSLGNLLFADHYFKIVNRSPLCSVAVYPKPNGRNPDIHHQKWSVGSRASILLDTEFRKRNYRLECIPTYQTKLSNKVVVLGGGRGVLVKHWVHLLSRLYNISKYPGVYDVIGKTEQFLWSVVFQRRLLRLLVKPILIRLGLYEKTRRWYLSRG